ncbi:MAG: hypothetical protein R3281_14925, partial [Balneolaceae bacterium]|nr:hypothetical protein [Balneolaceae bacterium]
MRTGITIKIFLLCSLLVLLLLPDARSQSPRFDYDRYPELDFTFSRLTLELNVDPEEQLLEGQATYQVAANIGGVDSLVLDAAHMEIRNVKVDGAEASYRLRNDSLFVAFAGPVRRGDRFAVDILYETSPIFGVHFEGESTAWSSSLPLSNRHWLPTVDHPRVTFNTDITLTIPGNMTAAAPGKIVSEEVSSVEQKNVRFRSDRPVPANMLWFAVGPFQRMETSFGIKQIQVLGPPDMMRQSGKKLLEQAYRLLEQAERRLGVEYPFETFQVLLLDYHRWETKSYNAGITYLFGNRGDLTAQLQRGVYSQWVGVMQREEQWSDAEAIIMHQVALNHRLRSGSESLLSDVDNPVVSVNPYHAFSVKHWNDWQQFYPNWEDSTWKTVIEEQLLPGLAEGGSVSGWNDFAEQWYEESGQPWFQPPQLALPSGPDTGPVTAGDSLVYRVDYQYDETKGELVLHFQALDSVVTELVSLPVIEYTGQQADTMQVTFTGADDKIMLNLDPLVSFVVIDETVVQNLRLEEYKPVPFILGQLRNATTAVQKAEAARQLA